MKQIRENVLDFLELPERTVRFLSAVSDSKRRQIVLFLSWNGLARAGEVEQSLGIPSNLLSFHLKKLHEAGLVWRLTTFEEEGPVMYELTPFGKKFLRVIENIEYGEKTPRRDKLVTETSVCLHQQREPQLVSRAPASVVPLPVMVEQPVQSIFFEASPGLLMGRPTSA